MRQVEGPWRAPCQLKKPFKGPRRRRGSCWEERKRIVFPRWGVIDLPSRQIHDFVQKGNRKNCVSGQTCFLRPHCDARPPKPFLSASLDAMRWMVSTELGWCACPKLKQKVNLKALAIMLSHTTFELRSRVAYKKLQYFQKSLAFKYQISAKIALFISS